jgi:hypothetical protein
MAFRWEKFGWWVCLALGLAGLGSFLLVGLPGVFVYVGWQALLNVIFQREVIAKLEGLGGGSWVVALYMSFLTPLGLPLGYIVALLPVTWLQGLPLLRHRNIWLLLFTLMSAEGSRYSQGGYIEHLCEYPRWFNGEMNADQLTIER